MSKLEKLYFETKKLLDLVVTGKEKGLLLYGESSLGKSFRVREALDNAGKIEGIDYFFISGHITPLQFYVKLHQAKDKIVVFDDVNILDNIINLNMLKAALNENSHGVVEYHTSRKMPKNVPNSFIFTGQVIILMNEKPNNNNMRAVENRILVHNLKFSYDEIISILKEVALLDKLDINKGVPTKERLFVVDWIKKNTDGATKNLNLRLYQHIMRFYKNNKDCWQQLALSQIQNDFLSQLVLKKCSDKDWVSKTGLSLKTKNRLRAKLGLTRSYHK